VSAGTKTMVRLARARLTPHAVARRGLNEGIGLTALRTCFLVVPKMDVTTEVSASEQAHRGHQQQVEARWF
jgi:hypothetical protein